MDEMSLRAPSVRRLLPLVVLLAIGLLLPAGASANVSNVKVSNSFVSESSNSFLAAPSQDYTYISFTPNVSLGPNDTILVKGPVGMSFSPDGNYGIGVGGLGGPGYSVAGVQITNGGRTVALTMNSIFDAPAGSRVQLQISDITLPHTAGSYTLALSTSEETTDVTSGPFNIVAGLPDDLVVSGGDEQSATVGEAFTEPLEVTARDQYDNPVAGLDVTFAVADTGASGSFGEEDATSSVVATNSEGVATSAALAANTVAGTWTATATAAGKEASFSLTNEAADPAALSLSGGDGQTAEAGTDFEDPLSVVVTDFYGNGVPGVSVSFSNPCGSGCGKFGDSDLGTIATTDATGTAESGTITAGSLAWNSASVPYEDWTVFITVGEILSTHATLTNVPGPLHHFVSSSGSFQAVGVGEPFEPVEVRAMDAWGNPLADVKVKFTAPDEGPSTSTTLTEQTTDGDGRADSGVFVANTHAGFWTLEISGPSGAVTTSATVQNLPGDPASAQVSLEPDSIPADGESQSDATVTVADQYGNPLPDETVTLSAQGPGDPPAIGPVHDRFDGTYGAILTASETSGEFEIEATVDGYPAATGSATLSQLDVAAPVARITKQPKPVVKTKRKRAKVKFRFRADEPATFQCRLDRKRWKRCSSPLKLKLRKGRHTLRIRAIDSAGNRGPAAKAKVRVVQKKQKRKRRRQGDGHR